MQQVHYADEVYRHHDGIRDPMAWSRFTGAKFMGGALLVALVVIIVGGSQTGPNPARQGIDAAYQVGGTAVGMALELSAP